jgi:hypothetical protein
MVIVGTADPYADLTMFIRRPVQVLYWHKTNKSGRIGRRDVKDDLYCEGTS